MKTVIIFFLLMHLIGIGYYLYLKDLNAPKAKRFYLLLGPLVISILASFDISFLSNWDATAPIVKHLPEFVIGTSQMPFEPGVEVNIWLALYLLGTALMAVRVFIGIVQIFQVKWASTETKLNGQRVFINPNISSPFAYFSWVFIKEPTADPLIISHELAHRDRHHSIDNLIGECYQILFWFMPVIWFWNQWTKQNHELEVDQVLQQEGENRYQEVLIKQAIPNWEMFLAQPLAYKSQLKNRIKMMQKKNQKNRAVLTMGFGGIIMLLAAMVLHTACTEKSIDNPAIEVENAVTNNAEEPYKVVDQMPKFPEGDKALFSFLGNNINYPKALEADGLEGVVFVSFIVDKSGAVRDAKILKGFATEAEEEALRVVNEMPDWEPGKHKGKAVSVIYNLPIRFALN